jgi:hypothetical protein
MEKIMLFSMENRGIKVTVETYFEGDNLIIDGYDIGDFVEKYWGDSDYEYSTTVKAEEVMKLYMLFKVKEGDRDGLLKAIAAECHDNSCYSNFRAFLDRNDIRYESFSWT